MYIDSSYRLRTIVKVLKYGSSSLFSNINSFFPKGWTTSDSTGLIQIFRNPDCIEEWLSIYEVPIKNGKVILYKAVGKYYRSYYDSKFHYRPGSIPRASDWDDGKKECGGGLHFCPTIDHAISFFPGYSHLIACPVKVDDIVYRSKSYFPTKIKARGCCAPIWKVDKFGKKI